MPGQTLFRVAACFNFLVGLLFLFGRSAASGLTQLDPATGTNELIANAAAVLIFSFGLVYWVISSNPKLYRPFVLVGMAGKLLAVAVAAQFLLVHGSANWHTPSLAVGDLILVFAFWQFYFLSGEWH